MKNADIIRQVKQVARERFAWPGGYPLMVVMADGECLCSDCARSEFGLIGRATRDADRSGWLAIGADVNWEDDSLNCAHCGEQIQSAYGND